MTPSRLARRQDALIRKITRAIAHLEDIGYISDTVFEFNPVYAKESVEVTIFFTKNGLRMRCDQEYSLNLLRLPKVREVRDLFDTYYREYVNATADF